MREQVPLEGQKIAHTDRDAGLVGHLPVRSDEHDRFGPLDTKSPIDHRHATALGQYKDGLPVAM